MLVVVIRRIWAKPIMAVTITGVVLRTSGERRAKKRGKRKHAQMAGTYHHKNMGSHATRCQRAKTL